LAHCAVLNFQKKLQGVFMSSDYACLEQLKSSSSLSQGDVIVWEKLQDFQSKAAVVVTADCDLAKGKHWGRITVVPIVPVAHYLEDIYLPKELSGLEPELVQLFAKEVHRALSTEETSPPTEEALESLVSLETLPKILNVRNLLELHDLLRNARGLTKSMQSATALDKALTLLKPKMKNLSTEKIGNFLHKPPGDCMILPQLPGLVPGLNIAFLRAMREVSDKDIATKNSEMEQDRAKRIGRLVPVLRYRLTQMLAQVFSDIGLPDEYEGILNEERSNFVKSITQSQVTQQ
jgi:hypothetical protein